MQRVKFQPTRADFEILLPYVSAWIQFLRLGISDLIFAIGAPTSRPVDATRIGSRLEMQDPEMSCRGISEGYEVQNRVAGNI